MRACIVIAVLSAVAFLGSGCTEAQEAADDAPAVEIPTVTASALDYAYEAPDTVTAGPIRFRFVNRDDEGHSLTVVELEGNRTMGEYLEAYREANRTGGPRPEWASFRGGTGLFGQGEASAVLDLGPGNYGLACFTPGSSGTLHLLEHGESHAFVVREGDGGAPAPSLPEPTVTVEMLDFSYELHAPISAGRQVIRVVNVGADPHHVLLFRMLPGKTREDYEAWVAADMETEAPAELAAVMTELSSGAEALLEVDLSPGDHVLVCLVAGRDEIPHIAKGMIQYIRVE